MFQDILKYTRSLTHTKSENKQDFEFICSNQIRKKKYIRICNENKVCFESVTLFFLYLGHTHVKKVGHQNLWSAHFISITRHCQRASLNYVVVGEENFAVKENLFTSISEKQIGWVEREILKFRSSFNGSIDLEHGKI